MEIPQGCITCPKVLFYSENLERAEAGKAVALQEAQRVMELRGDMFSAVEERQRLLESGREMLDNLEGLEASPANILFNLIAEDTPALVERLGRLDQEAAEKSEEALTTADQHIVASRTSIDILVGNCEDGVRQTRKLFGGCAVKCGSQKIKAADENYRAQSSSL